MRRKLATTLATLGAVAMAWAGPAGADPVNAGNAEVIPLDCDGTSYEVVVNGNGQFTPGHDVDSNAVLVPVAFGPFTGVVTDADGKVVDTFTEEGGSKGQSAKRGDFTTCTFTFTFTNTGPTEEDGIPPGGTFTGTGTVDVRITPAR